MSKQIQRDEEIYVAPEMLGKYESGTPVVIDERNSNGRLDPTNVEHKIEIYEREVKEWFLKPAQDLLTQNSFKNSFLVLMVCMSYIEGVEQYKTGIDSSRRSKDCFIDSIRRLYPDQYNDGDIGKLYSKSRCGLFHNGMVKGGVIFNNSYEDIIKFEQNGEVIKINPQKLLQDVENDFDRYINELKNIDNNSRDRNNRTARENFDRMFSVL
jgi:hypothetical protein